MKLDCDIVGMFIIVSFGVDWKTKMAATTGQSFSMGSYEKILKKNILLWNHWTIWKQTLVVCSLDDLQNV